MFSLRTGLTWISFAVSAPFLLCGDALSLLWQPIVPVQARSEAGPVFVPYPDGLRLIAAIEGSVSGKPELRWFQLPRTWNGLPLIPYRAGRQVAGRLDAAVEGSRQALRRMREIALQACNATLSTGDRAVLDVEFQSNLFEVDRQSLLVAYQGVALLGGSDSVYFETRDADGAPFLYRSANLSSSALELSGASFDVTNAARACAVLPTIDAAIGTVLRQRETVLDLRSQVGQGTTGGGLLAIESLLEQARDVAVHAAASSLPTAERFPFFFFAHRNLQRIDTIARAASFEGIPLLDGSAEVCLEGAPPLHLPILLELPDATLENLRLAGGRVDLLRASSAAAAVVALDAALDKVAGYRADLEAVRERLTGGTRRIR